MSKDVESRVADNAIQRFLQRLNALPMIGYLYLLIVILIFNLYTALTKISSTHPAILSMYRGGVYTVGSLLTVWYFKLDLFPKGQLTALTIRAITNSLNNLSLMYTMQVLPLGDAHTLLSIMPVVATVLGIIFLKEKCNWIDITVLFTTTFGILLVLQPPLFFASRDQLSSQYYLAAFIGVAGAIISAVGFVANRSAKKVSTAVVTSWMGVMGTLVSMSVALMLNTFELASVKETPLVLLIAILSFVSGALLSFCFRLEPVRTVTLVNTGLTIVISYSVQMLFFNDEPNVITIVGVAIVLSSIMAPGIDRYRKRDRETYQNLNPSQ